MLQNAHYRLESDKSAPSSVVLTIMMASIGATKVQIACVPFPDESQQLQRQVIVKFK